MSGQVDVSRMMGPTGGPWGHCSASDIHTALKAYSKNYSGSIRLHRYIEQVLGSPYKKIKT